MDHPTRRLDQPTPAPTDRSCLRCRAEMVEAAVGGYGFRLTRQVGYNWIYPKRATTYCTAWVCPACGYTELAATNPAALRDS
jgi:hypothetical protein